MCVCVWVCGGGGGGRHALTAEPLLFPLDLGAREAAWGSVRGTEPGTAAGGEASEARTALVRASRNSWAATPPKQQAAGASTSISLTCHPPTYFGTVCIHSP